MLRRKSCTNTVESCDVRDVVDCEQSVSRHNVKPFSLQCSLHEMPGMITKENFMLELWSKGYLYVWISNGTRHHVWPLGFDVRIFWGDHGDECRVRLGVVRRVRACHETLRVPASAWTRHSPSTGFKYAVIQVIHDAPALIRSLRALLFASFAAGLSWARGGENEWHQG